MTRPLLRLSLLSLSLGLAFSVHAASPSALRTQSDAMARLSAATGTAPEVSYHPLTGAARFVRLPQSAAAGRMPSLARSAPATDAARQERSLQFLKDYGGLFGVSSAQEELGAAQISKDRYGGVHVTHRQFYRGLPVFGAELKTHYDAGDQLVAANGTFIPGIQLDTAPRRTAEEAARIAIRHSAADLGRAARLAASTPTLMVYRAGFAQGVEGSTHLAWQVIVGNGVDVRDFVYVDAHTGKVIDKMTGIHEAKNRRAFDSQGATAPGPNYPASPFWVEGQPFPTGTAEADNMIAASSEVHELFKNAFGRDSFDGKGATMDSIFNRGDSCPNASWNGRFISFCPGTTTDDITAHEWGHAYTEYTHGLVYHWQPGALNEAYSDIWGETVDRINGRGGDGPDGARTDGACTTSTPLPPQVVIAAPASLAGPKDAGSANWGPASYTLNGSLAGVEVGSTSAACNALPPGSLSGKIAFIDRGTCAFTQKAQNAQNAGAIAVIIGNNQGGTTVLNMSGTGPTVPTMSVTQNTGTAIKAALLAGTPVTLSMSKGARGTDNSVRWLMGEDSSGFGGAIRDMYTPTCYGNPGKVSDKQYVCGPDTRAGDWGGVHSNSGVPNHGYALLVDGGSYNGQTIAAIGLTKAAHIYYRAQTVYQGPYSDFSDHANALEQSCRDLTGMSLNDLKTGAASGQVISAGDCAQVAKMALAVELRSAPAQCNFKPILEKNPPALCGSGTVSSILSDNFDGGRRGGVKWQVSHAGSSGDFSARDWGVVSNLPGSRLGYAMFAVDTAKGTCAPGGDETGVQRLDSPEFTVPVDAIEPRLSFDHWVASEAGFDGGNVKISVNGGAWQVVKAADFLYNPYNATLVTAAAGNTNPMAGEPAFTGSDSGTVKGSWGRSIVNLAPYAKPNDKVKLRFEFGNDGCGGTFGWYVDDVTVYRCTP